MIDFSIAISSCNRLDCLKKCLESVKISLDKCSDYEIVIVDNSSRQDIKDYLNKLTNINTFHNIISGDYSNHNKKFEVSIGKFIYHCCDNYLINNPGKRDWLQDIRNVFEDMKDSRVAVVTNELSTSRVVCPQGQINWNCVPRKELGEISYGVLGTPRTHVYPVAGWTYRKDYFNIIGGFESDVYPEQNNLWQLIRKKYYFAVLFDSATTSMIPRMRNGRNF